MLTDQIIIILKYATTDKTLVVLQFCHYILIKEDRLNESIGGFPAGSNGKESACKAGDAGSVPALGGSPGEAHGDSLQYSCLENPVDRGAWWAIVHRFAKSGTRLK